MYIYCTRRYWIKSSISLTIVMGIGWIGNVFFFSEELLFIAYIMTVFISAQGIIIFILYVPLSNNVSNVFMRGRESYNIYIYNTCRLGKSCGDGVKIIFQNH